MSGRTLGFVGVGRMGSHMARRLVSAGHKVVVYDADSRALQRATESGANAAHSPADVAGQAEIVLASLPTPDIVKAVALSPKDGLIAGSRIRIFIDLSTTGPRVAGEVALGLEEKGIVAVDAPVSGGPSGAEKGTLAVMVSGPKRLSDDLTSVLCTIGKVFWVGESAGLGQTMKLCNNLLSAAAISITSEALVLGTKAGLDPAVMLDVINAGSGRNTATADKFPRCVLPRKFDFGFATSLLYKDVRLCLEEGERLGVPMIVGNAVRQLIGITKAVKGEDSDITEIVQPVEQWAGAEVKSPR
ncbi:MAG: NAD(P)-dependent oxidoreductase [Bradyrhizobiaceae bacterium]|nr:NAD(P)-dependent oxidoreductase [Bradyrhizobiaceae bacterium]